MALEAEAALEAAGAIPSIPRDADGPVFREPWEAQAFAMAVSLHASGLFSWNEWAATLADEIARLDQLLNAQACPPGPLPEPLPELGPMPGEPGLQSQGRPARPRRRHVGR